MATKKNIINDVVSAREGTVTFEADGKRYECGTVTKFDAKFEQTTTVIKQLGNKIDQNKAVSGKISGNITMHFHDPYMLRLLVRFLEQGIQPSFNVTVNNADVSSQAGRQSVLYLGCLFTELALSNLDAEATDPPVRETPFTANDIRFIEQYKTL